jgi:hypothetical protein
MNRLTLEQAKAVADTLCVEPETVASNGLDGEIHMAVPNFTTDEAKAFLEAATDGFDLDWSSIEITEDRMEDSDVPVTTIKITTLEF